MCRSISNQLASDSQQYNPIYIPRPTSHAPHERKTQGLYLIWQEFRGRERKREILACVLRNYCCRWSWTTATDSGAKVRVLAGVFAITASPTILSTSVFSKDSKHNKIAATDKTTCTYQTVQHIDRHCSTRPSKRNRHSCAALCCLARISPTGHARRCLAR